MIKPISIPPALVKELKKEFPDFCRSLPDDGKDIDISELEEEIRYRVPSLDKEQLLCCLNAREVRDASNVLKNIVIKDQLHRQLKIILEQYDRDAARV